jgi:hypothetical protein
MQTVLRENLIQQADKAILIMLGHVHTMLEASNVFGLKPQITKMDQVKHKELQAAIFDLGSISRMLADEIGRWKRGEDRVLGRNGIENNLLNELYATLETMLWFFQREGIDVEKFSLDEVRTAHYDLIRCNRLL